MLIERRDKVKSVYLTAIESDRQSRSLTRKGTQLRQCRRVRRRRVRPPSLTARPGRCSTTPRARLSPWSPNDQRHDHDRAAGRHAHQRFHRRRHRGRERSASHLEAASPRVFPPRRRELETGRPRSAARSAAGGGRRQGGSAERDPVEGAALSPRDGPSVPSTARSPAKCDCSDRPTRRRESRRRRREPAAPSPAHRAALDFGTGVANGAPPRHVARVQVENFAFEHLGRQGDVIRGHVVAIDIRGPECGRAIREVVHLTKHLPALCADSSSHP